MKFGFRAPSIKKSISASTKGRIKRSVKGFTNPLYGLNGMGWINNPKKAAYNAVYHRTTIGIRDIAKSIDDSTSSSNISNSSIVNQEADVRIHYETREEMKKIAEQIVAILDSFDIKIKILMVQQNKLYTTYFIQPGSGIRISDIENLKLDIAMHLCVPEIKIVPYPEKGAIGIEIAHKMD